MSNPTRREILQRTIGLASLSLFGLPEWALPALAEGETIVPFTDIPKDANFNPAPDRRNLDIRTIDGMFTPKDKFFTTQHYGHPDVDPAALGYEVAAFITLEIRQPGGHDPVAERLAAIPEVLEVHTITGAGDLLCRVVARSNADLQRRPVRYPFSDERGDAEIGLAN